MKWKNRSTLCVIRINRALSNLCVRIKGGERKEGETVQVQWVNVFFSSTTKFYLLKNAPSVLFSLAFKYS